MTINHYFCRIYKLKKKKQEKTQLKKDIKKIKKQLAEFEYYNTKISEIFNYNPVNDADVVVLCIGEPGIWTGENKTRAEISIPQEQLAMLDRLVRNGKKVVTVVLSGRPLDLREVSGKSDAVLYAWSPGHMGGNAVDF